MGRNFIYNLKSLNSDAGRANRTPLIVWAVLFPLFMAASLWWAFHYRQYVPAALVAVLGGLELGNLWKAYVRCTATYRLNTAWSAREREQVQEEIHKMQVLGLDSIIGLLGVTVYSDSLLEAEFWEVHARMETAMANLRSIESSGELANAVDVNFSDAFRTAECIPAFREVFYTRMGDAKFAMQERNRFVDNYKRYLDDLRQASERHLVN